MKCSQNGSPAQHGLISMADRINVNQYHFQNMQAAEKVVDVIVECVKRSDQSCLDTPLFGWEVIYALAQAGFDIAYYPSPRPRMGVRLIVRGLGLLDDKETT